MTKLIRRSLLFFFFDRRFSPYCQRRRSDKHSIRGVRLNPEISCIFFFSDGNGSLCYEELADLIPVPKKSKKVKPPTRAEILDHIAELDTDGNGCLCFRSFLCLFHVYRHAPGESLSLYALYAFADLRLPQLFGETNHFGHAVTDGRLFVANSLRSTTGVSATNLTRKM